MTSDEPQRLSEAMAEQLWKRAAELQVEAARRLEANSRAEAESELMAESGDSGYALAHVRQAAVEAGISPEFVEAALSELTVRASLEPHELTRLDSLGELIMGRIPELLEARRDIAASPREVSQAMERMLLAAPYGLSVRDAKGDPLNGGTVVFDIPPVVGVSAYTSFQYECSWASLKQVMISIHPQGPNACQLVVRAPTGPGRRLGAGIGAAFTGAVGFAGAVGGLVAGIAIGGALGVDGGSLAAVAGGLALAAAGAGTTATIARSLYKRLFHYGLGRSRKAMEGLASAINTSFVVGWGGGRTTALPDPAPQQALPPAE